MEDEELTVRLLNAEGEPLPIAGVLLDIRFYVGGRFRYSFSLGQTDAEGVCRSSLQPVERQLEANRRLFLMDYNTPLTACDAAVGIAAPTAGELNEREAVRAKWWPETPSPEGGAANQRVRCKEQRFELQQGSNNAFRLVCEVEEEA